MRAPLSLLSITLLVVACSSAGVGQDKYSCPGIAGGALCASPIDVYRMTDSADHVLPRLNGKASRGVPARGDPTGSGPMRVQPPLKQPQPVLEPAQVMRIWIAPWIDTAGDLHFPSFLFTEITPRQWTIGEDVARAAQIVVPLQVDTVNANRVGMSGDGETPGGLSSQGRNAQKANETLPAAPSDIPPTAR